ncbi:hypothetical protein [Pantoea endophytica]
MKRFAITRAALVFVMMAGLSASAISSDAVTRLSEGYGQLLHHFDVSALTFSPAQPDVMNAILTRLNVRQQADGDGLYVLDATSSRDVMHLLQEGGKTGRKLHIRLPAGEDGKAGAFSMRPDGEFSASLKAHYLESVKQLPPAVILDYSLKATLGRPTIASSLRSGTERLRYVSGGSVLLPDKAALMSIRQTDSGYLIWLVSTY